MLAVIAVTLFFAVVSGAPQEAKLQQPLQAYLIQGSQFDGTQIPAGAQVIYLQGATTAQQYSAPTQGAQIAYIIGAPQQQQQFQVSSVQPSQQVSTIQYSQPQTQQVSSFQYSQPQTQQVQYKPPQVQTKVYSPPAVPALAPAPKPLTKEYHVHESQVPQWAILRSNLDDNFDGHFQYDFETENGIALNAVGAVKQLSPKEQAQVIQGSYSYTAPDGRLITTTYTADENGFIAQGDHLPVPPAEPELPPLIAKSLAYIRSLPPQPEYQQ